MRFTPKSEQEIQQERFPLLAKGKYHFEIFRAEEKVSKRGTEMIALGLRIMDSGLNNVGICNDFLMAGPMEFKIKHCADACGLSAAYQTGELHAGQFLHKTGICEIGIQKDKTGQYSDRNCVNDYYPTELTKAAQGISAAPGFNEDDIPF